MRSQAPVGTSLPSQITMISRIGRRVYYGWVIVAVCTVVLVIAFGVRLSFTVFYVALLTEFGWSRADTALIFSLTMVIFMAGSTITGYLLDRLGARIMFGSGAALIAIGLLLSSRITTFNQLVWSYGVLVGIGITALGLSQQAAVIGRWFRRRLGIAIGIAFAGTGIGALAIVPLISTVVERGGWRTGFVVLAACSAATIVPIVYFMRREPAQLGLKPYGAHAEEKLAGTPIQADVDWRLGAAARTARFWLLIVAGFCTMGPIRMLTVHQIALMNDAGFSLTEGATVAGIAGGTTALTAIAAGALSDRIGRSATFLIGGICLLASLVLIGTLHAGSSLIVLWVYAPLLGIGEGSRSSLVTAVTGDLFPGRSLGAISGAVGSAFGAGAGLYPWLAGFLYDATGSYDSAIWIGGATVLISIATLMLANRYRPTSISQGHT